VSDKDQRERVEDPPGPDAGPDSPRHLGGRSWWAAIKRTIKEFSDDNLTDWAAALTYYGVLSIFPGLLVLVSLMGLLDKSTTNEIVGNILSLVPGSIRGGIQSTVDELQRSRAAGLVAILGLAGALWSASGYVGAFMRAANAIYDVPEGRPVWKTVPVRLGVTVVTGVLLVVSALLVVFTGRLAELAGNAIGLGSTFVTIWDILKWPVLVILVSLMFAILYWASPNARQGGFHWITPGGLLAVLLWIAASVGFSVYVSNFGSYNKTYGALAGVIVFLVWLWISNIAVLFGAEFDAELERQRTAEAGHDPDKEPYLQLRDDRKVKTPPRPASSERS
jgi:membrane protein